MTMPTLSRKAGICHAACSARIAISRPRRAGGTRWCCFEHASASKRTLLIIAVPVSIVLPALPHRTTAAGVSAKSP
jgi:hypothetical protein